MKMPEEETSTAKNIENNIGCLVYLGMAIPFIHHFMSRLCDIHLTAVKRQSIKINGEYRKDLEMMLSFLKMANDGISMNSIAFQKPTYVYCSDLCPPDSDDTAMKDGRGDGIYPKNCFSEHRTTCSNILLPSYHHGLTSSSANSIVKTVYYP